MPDSEGGTGRWSLDHLFIDRNGVPVLVEVKRASDTRARREVVAQMLDYAANGVAYWPLPRLIEAFRRTAEEQGQDPDALLSALLGENGDPENYWRQVEANLRSGRIRIRQRSQGGARSDEGSAWVGEHHAEADGLACVSDV